jgi:alginate O-acetyltransferase complex protein AlgI
VLFNSWIFLPFILIVFALYFALPLRGQNRMLLVASYVFYGAWDWRFLFLIALSTVVDYFVGIAIDRCDSATRRRRWLLLSMSTNLGILGFFKYFNFFIDSATSIFAWFGLEASAGTLSIVLPVGISFYTFQTMSYTIDIYRDKLKPTTDFLDFALFVSFFPQLVAGPIERATSLIPQLTSRRTVTSDLWFQGLWLVLWGLFKKLVVADNLGPVVDDVFDPSKPVTGPLCWLGVYGFAFQIYCDFSGYSDVARGIAKLMGIDLMVNFRQPYLSTGPAEFWDRWHISLSTWLRDYLYIPLGGNRGGSLMTYRNLCITMLLGGLWHGAAWHFVGWGAFHGLILVIERLVRRPGRRTKAAANGALSVARRVAATIFFFHVTCMGWLLFRANDMEQAYQFAVIMFSDFDFNYVLIPHIARLSLLVSGLWVIEAWMGNRDDPRGAWGWNRGVGPIMVTVMFIAIVLLAPPGGRDFIYFQF